MGLWAQFAEILGGEWKKRQEKCYFWRTWTPDLQPALVSTLPLLVGFQTLTKWYCSLLGLTSLVTLCAHHSSSNILTRCQLSSAIASVTSWLDANSPVLLFPSAWEERVHLAALHSSSTEPAGPWWGCLSRAAHLVSIWRSTARTRRAMGKRWPSWSQSSPAGRQDHSGRSVCRQTVIPLFVQLRKSWTIFLEITSLILQVCCTDYAAR